MGGGGQWDIPVEGGGGVANTINDDRGGGGWGTGNGDGDTGAGMGANDGGAWTGNRTPVHMVADMPGSTWNNTGGAVVQGRDYEQIEASETDETDSYSSRDSIHQGAQRHSAQQWETPSNHQAVPVPVPPPHPQQHQQPLSQGVRAAFMDHQANREAAAALAGKKLYSASAAAGVKGPLTGHIVPPTSRSKGGISGAVPAWTTWGRSQGSTAPAFGGGQSKPPSAAPGQAQSAHSAWGKPKPQQAAWGQSKAMQHAQGGHPGRHQAPHQAPHHAQWGQGGEADGWGHHKPADNGWGNQHGRDSGWGNQEGGEDGWGHHQGGEGGWGHQATSQEGWGQAKSSRSQKGHKGHESWGAWGQAGTGDDDDESYEEDEWGNEGEGDWGATGGDEWGLPAAAMGGWGDVGKKVTSAPSGGAGTRNALSPQQRSQILNSLLNQPNQSQNIHAEFAQHGHGGHPQKTQHKQDKKPQKQQQHQQGKGQKGNKVDKQQKQDQQRHSQHPSQQYSGWGTDDGWGAIPEEDEHEDEWDESRKVHFSSKTPQLWTGSQLEQSERSYSMPSKTLAHAYKGTTTSINSGLPRNKMNDYTNVQFVESRGAAFEPVSRAFFGKERLARDRIHWTFDPNKDERVSSLLTWIQTMHYNIGAYGVS